MSANQRYADAVSQILTHKGDIEAEGIRRQADIQIGAISSIGQTVTQGVQLYSAQHKEAQIQNIFKTTPDLDEAVRKVSAIDPQRGMTYAKGLLEARKTAAELLSIKTKAQREETDFIANTLGSAKDQAGWTQATIALAMAGVDPKKYPAQYDPAIAAQFQRQSLTAADRQKADAPLPPVISAPDAIGRDPRNLGGPPLFVNPPAPPKPPAPPQIGTPAYDVWARQQEILNAGGPPAAAAPPVTPPPALSVDQVEGRAPAAPSPPAPAPTPGLTPTAAAIKAFSDSRDAARDPSVAADRTADNTRADAQLELSRGQLEVSRGQLALARQRANKPGATASDKDGLVDAVIASPGLWDQLTPTEKGKIAPELNRRGFGDLGKPLAGAAVSKISDSKTAVDSLKDLKQVLKDNEQYIGPIAGFAALNPYSDANKAQAKIDLVRQRVGKSLEGGVLRKEDEEKYKKILATLRDTPSTAVSKIDGLIQSLENDITNFINEQRLAGRRVATTPSGRTTTPAPTSTSTKQVGDRVTYQGKSYRIKAIVNGQAELEAAP